MQATNYAELEANAEPHEAAFMDAMRALQGAQWEWAEAKGWNERPVGICEQASLLVTEIAEAVEAWREGQEISWTDENGKPQGVASEYADVVIRLLHYCSMLRIDLGAEVVRKMQFNWTRSHRHGGKRG